MMEDVKFQRSRTTLSAARSATMQLMRILSLSSPSLLPMDHETERDKASECAIMIAALTHGADLTKALKDYESLMAQYDSRPTP